MGSSHEGLAVTGRQHSCIVIHFDQTYATKISSFWSLSLRQLAAIRDGNWQAPKPGAVHTQHSPSPAVIERHYLDVILLSNHNLSYFERLARRGGLPAEHYFTPSQFIRSISAGSKSWYITNVTCSAPWRQLARRCGTGERQQASSFDTAYDQSVVYLRCRNASNNETSVSRALSPRRRPSSRFAWSLRHQIFRHQRRHKSACALHACVPRASKRTTIDTFT